MSQDLQGSQSNSYKDGQCDITGSRVTDKGSVVNIYGGSYTGMDAPIVTAIEGSRVNIYRGIFKAEAFTGSAAPTDAFVNFDEASGSDVNIYGGTFVNFDPSASAYGNLVDESCVVLTTHRDNGEIWYTVVPKENQGYTPVFSAEEIRKACNDRVDSIVIACDINLDKDTETLLRGEAGHTLVVDGLGAIITPDGTGTAPGSQDYGYIGFIPKPGEDAVISNMRFTGRGFVEVGHHREGGGTFTVSNLVIEDLIATLHIINDDNRISPAFTPYGINYLIDCVMTGTTTEKVGYKPYDAAFVSGTQTFIQGGKYGTVYTSRHTQLTINGAEIGNLDCYVIKVSGGKGKLTIGADAKIGTLNIIPYGKYPPSIVIEEGAEIGVINYNGDSYTLEQWLART